MADRNQAKNQRIETTDQVPEVKIVAEMPEDPEIREHLKEMQENDGYKGSCGGL
ncbi:hypothetical protein [Paenibacillus sp. Soil522]|uniref:hypothetical protein n=1 Tax=Paenibacillus sp. Soil522 TaxID=1736388 RepID=UPI000B1DC363|nr:hypothetical protein [Paenibacillus sp. Soil522]